MDTRSRKKSIPSVAHSLSDTKSIRGTLLSPTAAATGLSRQFKLHRTLPTAKRKQILWTLATTQPNHDRSPHFDLSLLPCSTVD